MRIKTVDGIRFEKVKLTDGLWVYFSDHHNMFHVPDLGQHHTTTAAAIRYIGWKEKNTYGSAIRANASGSVIALVDPSPLVSNYAKRREAHKIWWDYRYAKRKEYAEFFGFPGFGY